MLYISVYMLKSYLVSNKAEMINQINCDESINWIIVN